MPTSIVFSLRQTSCVAVILLLTVLISGPVSGQDSDDALAPMFGLGTRPLVTLNFASVNRLKDRASFLFETAETPAAMDTIMQMLDDNVNGLDGLDWDRPGGVMMFMNSVFPPALEFVAYVPLSSVEEFQAMVERGPVIMQKKNSDEGRYELIGPRNNVPVRVQGDYAFLQLPVMNPDPAFERDLPNPLNLIAGLSHEFDVSLSFEVDAVPKPTRDLMYNMLSSYLSTEHQQRDDEPDAVYAVRDAWQKRDIAALKMLFQDAKRLAMGFGISKEEASVNIDMLMEARDASDMLEEMFLSVSKPSSFSAIASDESPASLIYSVTTTERDSIALANVFEAAKGWLALKIEEDGQGDVPQDGSPLFQALTALSETARSSQFDLFSQAYQDSSDKVAVVGAVRLKGGEAIAAGLRDALIRLEGREGLGDIEIGAKQHAGITFHKIQFDRTPEQAVMIMGKSPGITVGVGPKSLWFVIGGEDGFDTLSGVIDQLELSYESPSANQLVAANRLIVNVGKVREIFGSTAPGSKATEEKGARSDNNDKDVDESANGRRGARGGRGLDRRARRQAAAGLFVEALEEGQDRIEVSIRPTDQGVRARMKMDTGFLRGIGRFVNSMISG